MSIQRWDPFRDMLNLRDTMNRMFEENWPRASILEGGTYGMALDLEETNDDYVVRASLPGFKPEDVNISVTGDTLSIQASRKSEEERTEKNYLVRERRTGSASRTITLPQRVAADKAEAKFDNGELVLTLPKAEEVKPRQIRIGVSQQQELPGSATEQH